MEKLGLHWKIHQNGKRIAREGIVAPDERLTWPRTTAIGFQHAVAMFGSTFLVPLLTGMPPSTTLLFSGLGTIIFLFMTAGKIPSYLGSSFAFIAPVSAVNSQWGEGSALGGIAFTGGCLVLCGLVVHKFGARWITAVMPPVISGTIVALIGFNLAPTAKENVEKSPLVGSVTVIVILLVSVVFRGILGRIAILLGITAGYVVALAQHEIDLSKVAAVPWLGLPQFHSPEFRWDVVGLFLPVLFVLVAENIGHIRSVSVVTGQNLDPLMGRALMADGVASIFAGMGGGSGTTTYAENIGVMAASRVYSTAAYWITAVCVILLSFCPKFGQLISSVPVGVLGGAGIVLYGTIGILGVRIWVEAKVNFGNFIAISTAGIALIIGIADFTLRLGNLSFGGITLGTLAALVIFHALSGIDKIRKNLANERCKRQEVSVE